MTHSRLHFVGRIIFFPGPLGCRPMSGTPAGFAERDSQRTKNRLLGGDVRGGEEVADPGLELLVREVREARPRGHRALAAQDRLEERVEPGGRARVPTPRCRRLGRLRDAGHVAGEAELLVDALRDLVDDRGCRGSAARGVRRGGDGDLGLGGRGGVVVGLRRCRGLALGGRSLRLGFRPGRCPGSPSLSLPTGAMRSRVARSLPAEASRAAPAIQTPRTAAPTPYAAISTSTMMNWRMNTSSALLTEAPRSIRARSLQTARIATSPRAPLDCPVRAD